VLPLAVPVARAGSPVVQTASQSAKEVLRALVRHTVLLKVLHASAYYAVLALKV
jgi:hypothetical protein